MKARFLSHKIKALFFLLLLGFSVGGVFFLAKEQSSILNFRTCQDSLKPSRFSPSLVGLRELNCSASGRLSKAKIEKYFKRLPSKVFVVDVRAEEDLYINGISAGWLGIRYFDGQVEDRLYTVQFWKKPVPHLKWGWRRLVNLKTLKTPQANQLQKEEQFLKNLGASPLPGD